jgi:hypothetical protein
VWASSLAAVLPRFMSHSHPLSSMPCAIVAHSRPLPQPCKAVSSIAVTRLSGARTTSVDPRIFCVTYTGVSFGMQPSNEQVSTGVWSISRTRHIPTGPLH